MKTAIIIVLALSTQALACAGAPDSDVTESNQAPPLKAEPLILDLEQLSSVPYFPAPLPPTCWGWVYPADPTGGMIHWDLQCDSGHHIGFMWPSQGNHVLIPGEFDKQNGWAGEVDHQWVFVAKDAQ